ncbi:MAG: beta-lactamase family protein [Bacteroidales bacterium]|nr:beta-lactamase family protein [Bacteroidales bacterium]
MKLTLKHFSILLLAAGLLLAGCSKDSTEPESEVESEVSKDSSLKRFSFQAASNTTLNVTCTSYGSGNIIYITVPEEVSLSSLVPTFTVHDSSTVTIDGKKVVSGVTAVDFSKTVTFKVTSEAGTASSYKVLARNGRSNIDNMIYPFMIKHDIPGISVAVSKDEETVYVGSYGFSNEEKEIRVNENTLFRLASMSKQHTAIAIMTLMERGLLDIDDTVFGKGGIMEEEFGDNMSRAWKNITLRDLLSHSSGIAQDCIFPSVSGYGGMTVEQRIARLLQTQENPGYDIGRFSYNNSNFGILGRVVETVSGMDFMEFLKKEVYSPIGIEDIYGGSNDRNKTRENECIYYAQGGKDAYGNDVEAGVAAGGVIASTPALMKLMAHLDYGTKVPDIFKKETLDLMYTAKEGMKTSSGAAWNRYGLGWRVNYPEITSWEAYHGGTLAGVCTIWARSKKNVNGVILCNSRSYDKGIDDEMWFILEDIQKLF